MASCSRLGVFECGSAGSIGLSAVVSRFLHFCAVVGLIPYRLASALTLPSLRLLALDGSPLSCGRCREGSGPELVPQKGVRRDAPLRDCTVSRSSARPTRGPPSATCAGPSGTALSEWHADATPKNTCSTYSLQDSDPTQRTEARTHPALCRMLLVHTPLIMDQLLTRSIFSPGPYFHSAKQAQ